jgi:hypothetical protein
MVEPADRRRFSFKEAHSCRSDDRVLCSVGQTAGDRMDVVGRATEIAVIDVFLDATPGGFSTFVFEGEQGIGKTNLAVEAVLRARKRGYMVLSCRPSRGPSPVTCRSVVGPGRVEVGASLPDGSSAHIWRIDGEGLHEFDSLGGVLTSHPGSAYEHRDGSTSSSRRQHHSTHMVRRRRFESKGPTRGLSGSPSRQQATPTPVGPTCRITKDIGTARSLSLARKRRSKRTTQGNGKPVPRRTGHLCPAGRLSRPGP